jgi:hypothetical protein
VALNKKVPIIKLKYYNNTRPYDIPPSYLEVLWFESRPTDRVLWLISLFFISTSKNILGCTFICHDSAVLQPVKIHDPVTVLQIRRQCISGLLYLLCGIFEVSKIWSPRGQHEFQYTERGMSKNTCNYMYNFICIFVYTLCAIKIYS